MLTKKLKPILKQLPVAAEYPNKAISAAAIELSAPLPVAQLSRHPANRHPKPEQIAKLKASLQEDGLLDPLLVRRLDSGFYQIVSGETRWLAAKELGWRDISCRLIECDDGRALELLAICNAKRADLDPIDKAKLINQLCREREAGGAGLTQAQAAAVFGFKSHAAASNLQRLLELPKVWQDRVASGEMPETFARSLLPYRTLQPLMAAADKDWQRIMKLSDGDIFLSREEWDHDLKSRLRDVVKRLDEDVRVSDKRIAQWPTYHPCRLDLKNEEIAKAIGLQRITLMVKGKATEIPVATNVKAFDKLQIEAIIAYEKTKAKKQTAKLEKGTKSKAELDPAERKRREQQRDEAVERRVRNWRHRWILSLVAAELSDDGLSWRLLAWLFMHGTHNAPGWSGKLLHAAGAKGDRYLESAEKWKILCGEKDDQDLRNTYSIVIDWLRDVLTDPDKDPRHPKIPYEVSEDLARRIGFDLVEEWHLLQSRGQNPMFDSFWDLFPSAWLEALALELKVNIDAAKTTTAKAECFRQVEKKLDLPKCLQLKTAKRGAK